jgi:hypothetical protein
VHEVLTLLLWIFNGLAPNLQIGWRAMNAQKHAEFEVVGQSPREKGLDLVVPFTTPRLTQVAMDSANRMGAGLDATIRLVKVQVVPFPMDLNQSPVVLGFIEEQLRHFRSELPAEPEIRMARDMEPGLLGTLKRDSVVVLGYRKRAWRTREERLAAHLWQAGYHAVLVPEQKEIENA